MNREDYLDSMTYWYKSMYHAESAIPLIKAKEDSNHITFYCSCNPDICKYYYDLAEQRVRIRPERSYTNYILYNKQEDKKMTQAEITYEAQKHELEQEEAAEFNQLLADQAAVRHNLKTKYDQKRFDLEKQKEDAEQKEKAEAYAKAVKETYDAYIVQGFTKAQAETFIKIALENQST